MWDFLVRVLMLHDPCMEQLSPSTSRSELDLQTSQPVNEEMQAWHITGSSDQGGGLGSCWSLACVWLLPPSRRRKNLTLNSLARAPSPSRPHTVKSPGMAANSSVPVTRRSPSMICIRPRSVAFMRRPPLHPTAGSVLAGLPP